MKAQKLPSGSYRVRVSVDGKRVSVTAATEDEAMYQALLLKAGRKKAPGDLTVGDCIDEYIKSKENVLSPATIEGYKRSKKNNLAELCGIPVSDLTGLDIQKHINQLALTKSAKTVCNAHGLLVAVLNVYAPDLRVRTTLPKVQKKFKQLPAVETVLAAVVGTDIELPCLLAMWCSLRMSEIRGAKLSDIKDGILTVHNTIITVAGEHIEKDSTKTIESARQIRLPQRIQSLIAALPPEQVYLTPLTGQALYKRFSRLLKHNGIEHISFHDLRHLNASVMLALGIPDKYAMERGGWASPNIMKSVYQHTFSAERQAADNKIDSYFEALLDTKTDTK